MARIKYRHGAVIAFALFVTSCGSGNGRQELEGSVTYQGKPLPYGTVTFEPDKSMGQNAVQASGEVVDGRLKTTPGFGARPGPHVALVTGYDRAPTDNGPAPRELFVNVSVPVVVEPGSKTVNLDVPDQSKPAQPRK